MHRPPIRAAWSLLLLSSLFAAVPAHAATIASVSPQGEVAQVRQVTVKFSEAVVAFGDPRLPDPVAVQCEEAAPAGAGRWSNDRVWLYDFREALGPGVRCTIKARPDWKPGVGGALSGRTEFSFSTGGPALLSVRPWPGSDVAEDQHFLLELSGPAAEASVAAKAWCEVEGLGDRLPLRVVTGAPREQLLKSQRITAPARVARTLVVACDRPLPGDTPVRLVWGRGIAAAANPAVLTRIDQRQAWRVRKPFTAEFSCERERANAPCLPIRAMRLQFSAPIARALAEQVRLQPAVGSGAAAGASLAPVFDKDDKSSSVTGVEFPKPLAENAAYTVLLPPGLKDDADRPLANAASFPLKVATGAAPPIAKFAAAPLGVLEFESADGRALLPLTLRHVQGDLRPAAPGGQVRVKRIDGSDADLLAWIARVQRHHERELTAREAGLPERDWFELQRETDAKGRVRERKVERYVASREIALLAKEADATRLDLPALQGGDPQPFEVIGLPIAAPGYHVVEVTSTRLGQALLDKSATMFVRTGVLATNLGVHFKHGRQDSLVWVTQLDRGRPVDGAEVAISDCRGKRLWAGRTDAQGIARVPQALDDGGGEDCLVDDGLLVTARKAVDRGPARGQVDLAFVFSGWQKGIESWRYDLPTSRDPQPDVRAHTVFDRTLLRAGETVSMKHFVRSETAIGLAALPVADLPTRVKIVHQGSGQEQLLPLQWATPGARSALSSWKIPPAAKLGAYDVILEHESADERRRRAWTSGSFRVEEFRVPLVDARLSAPKAVPPASRELAIGVQLNYQSGGGVAQAPLRASALLKDRALAFDGYEGYVFTPPRDVSRVDGAGDEDDDRASSRGEGRLVADKLALATDAQGAARVLLKDLPAITRASELLTEVTFNDPNGEAQTASTRVALWPSAVVLGVRAGSWVSARGRTAFTVVALDTAGKPLADQAVEVRGRVTQIVSTRKRMVGGFYAYDNRQDIKDLGVLCSGRSDARGLLACDAELSASGQVELIAQARDAAGNAAQAAASVWVTRQGELWFAQDNDDRIDLLPEKRRYEVGETARLQVRMPFREATALLSVEREGMIATRVVTLRGDDPTVDVKIEPGWGPNVYVSVLALRGRIREVPWYSFFAWGWQSPVEWWRAWRHEGKDYQPPTAMVDLARPAFKLGVAALQVGIAEHALQVRVTADKPQYAVRQKAVARIQVTQGGQPVQGGEIAFAAVDEGLLALLDNASWDLLGAMLKARPWGVETSTAQSEIVGRRHYGRKAVAAGGGGGRGATRELFDTLLLWQASVPLDAKGEATVEVPLNDSLTSFRLVAVADAGVQRFGSGSTQIRVSQDLQLLPGLPPLVREGDRYTALMTLRNTTAREMKLEATLQGAVQGGTASAAIALPPQDLVLAAGAAKEVTWSVEVPAEASAIAWEAAAMEQGRAADAAQDRVKLVQRVAPAVPLRVFAATLAQVDGSFGLPVAAPADALPASGVKRGGLQLALQPRLSSALPGLRRYFETYPYSCLEQKASKAIGLRDAALWTTLANELPSYLDADGLAAYFPPRAQDAPGGSDRLTAYLIAAAHEAGYELPVAAREQMLNGLAAWVEGRIERRFQAPRADGDARRLAAIEALSRHGRAQPRMLGTVSLAPNTWPTAAVIDWLNILRRVPGIPDQARRLEEAQQVLRARLTWSGTTLKFSTEQDDFWWWLMDSADANASRLILALLDDPVWKDELPRLVVGSLGRQRNGAWLTTTANLWGSLALDKFSKKFESTPVAGRSVADTGGAPVALDWAAQPQGGTLALPWPAAAGTLSVAQQGSGKPWLAVQGLAAVPLKAPLRAGYAITRSVAAVEQKNAGRWTRGDLMRVRLEVDAQADMGWVVVSDPVPAGAALLGSGLGRDSAIATQGEQREGRAWPAYEERGFEAFRSYYAWLPRGRHVVEYTLRLNNPGRFALPPSRVEAMYAPESFGESPNAMLEVGP